MIRSLVDDAATEHKEEFLAILRLSYILLLNEKALKKKDYLVILYILVDNKNKIPSYAIINNSATTYAFIDENYARCKNLSLYKLKKPCRLKIFDEILTTSSDITHVTKVQLKIE